MGLAYIFISWLFFLAGTHAQTPVKWDLNDVSYLVPLPGLLGPEQSGSKGQLLPLSVFSRVPTLLNNGLGNATLYASALRVVSLRIDPCPEAARPCAPEVRLVWQPVEWEDPVGWTTRDGAIHTFYSLTNDELTSLQQELWRLKLANLRKGVSTVGAPLHIHPAFLNPQTAMDFRSRLPRVILNYCGKENLQKMTFMSLLVPATWWRFGSFKVSEAGLEQEVIPRLTMNFEDIFNSGLEDGPMDTPGTAMDAIFNVLPETYDERDNLFPVINKGFRYNDERDFPIFESKLDAVARFQNPHKTNARTLDCASCHFADATAYYSTLRFAKLAVHHSSDAYKNPDNFNLTNTTVGARATRVIRGFGYFKNEPAMIQRVIHDSAESAHWFNTKRN